MPPPWQRAPRVTAQPDPSEFPDLLDQQQWTQSATFSQSDRFSGPSERIGRYYRQRLDELDAAGLEQKHLERTAPASPLRPTIERKGWAAGLPCRPLLDPMGPAATAAAEEAAQMSASAPDLSSSALGILGRQRAAADAQARRAFEGTRRHQHITRYVDNQCPTSAPPKHDRVLLRVLPQAFVLALGLTATNTTTNLRPEKQTKT